MKRHNILFIDDDLDVLESYKLIFRDKEDSESLELIDDLFGGGELKENEGENPFNIFICSQGEEAIELIEQKKKEGIRFKAAFVDMRMPPGIDGKETCRRIREIDQDMEFVIVTAYSDHDIEDVVEYVGAPDKLLYLKKPFDPIEIRQLASNLCSKWDMSKIKDEFLTNLSHELRTPLVSIIGFSDLLLSGDIDEEYFKIIKNNGNFMKGLIEDLFTIIKFGKESLYLDEVDFLLSDLVNECKDVFGTIPKEKGIEFVVECPSDLTLKGDPSKIKQIIINLLSNAFKFTVEGEVSLKALRMGDDIVIKLSDTGIGINNDKLQIIFERFERLEKNHHEIPGLGLGLSICKTLTNLHGGSIEVMSTEGKGSEFILNFKKRAV